MDGFASSSAALISGLPSRLGRGTSAVGNGISFVLSGIAPFLFSGSRTERRGFAAESGYEQRVINALVAIKPPTAATLHKGVAGLFKREPERAWRDHIEAVAEILKTRKRIEQS
jgi:hypothetical protein